MWNAQQGHGSVPYQAGEYEYSSSENDYPVSALINESNVLSEFNLPGSPDHSEESDNGWSDNSGNSTTEYLSDTNNSHTIDHQAIEASLMNSAGDGLELLYSDDDNQVEEEGNNLSSSALGYHAYSRQALRPTEEHRLEPESNDGYSKSFESDTIPAIVTHGDVQMYESSDYDLPMEDCSRNYDSRYDGTLQECTGIATNSNDKYDSKNSSAELSGYLSSGDMSHGPGFLLTPNVGERPPTPPSPRKSSKLSIAALHQQFPGQQLHPVAMLGHEEDAHYHGANELEHVDNGQQAVLHAQSQDTDNLNRQHEYHQDAVYTQSGLIDVNGIDSATRCLPSGDVNQPDEHDKNSNQPENIVVGSRSGLSTAEELSHASQTRKRDRKVISFLIVALGCALFALAGLVGGIVALTVFRDEEDKANISAAPTSVPLNVRTASPVTAPSSIASSKSPSIPPQSTAVTRVPQSTTPTRSPVSGDSAVESTEASKNPTTSPTMQSPTEAPIRSTKVPSYSPTPGPTLVPSRGAASVPTVYPTLVQSVSAGSATPAPTVVPSLLTEPPLTGAPSEEEVVGVTLGPSIVGVKIPNLSPPIQKTAAPTSASIESLGISTEVPSSAPSFGLDSVRLPSEFFD